MAKEIERKFIVKPRDWNAMARGVTIRQGYLAATEKHSVRVRVYGDKAYIAIKGATVGATRDEFEYEIPLADANQILDRLCETAPIDKVRYRIPFEGHTFEVDIFDGVNKGLNVAEVEMKSADEKIALPEWIDREITGDPRYFNSNLSLKPFTTW